jgi:hypothetical protein
VYWNTPLVSSLKWLFEIQRQFVCQLALEKYKQLRSIVLVNDAGTIVDGSCSGLDGAVFQGELEDGLDYHLLNMVPFAFQDPAVQVTAEPISYLGWPAVLMILVG